MQWNWEDFLRTSSMKSRQVIPDLAGPSAAASVTMTTIALLGYELWSCFAFESSGKIWKSKNVIKSPNVDSKRQDMRIRLKTKKVTDLPYDNSITVFSSRQLDRSKNRSNTVNVYKSVKIAEPGFVSLTLVLVSW